MQLALFADDHDHAHERDHEALFAPNGGKRCEHCQLPLTAFGGRWYCLRVGWHVGRAMTDRLLTAEDLAARWQVPKSHVYRLGREGKVPVVRLGKYMRFRLDAIERFELGIDTEKAGGVGWPRHVSGPAALERPGPWQQEARPDAARS